MEEGIEFALLAIGALNRLAEDLVNEVDSLGESSALFESRINEIRDELLLNEAAIEQLESSDTALAAEIFYLEELMISLENLVLYESASLEEAIVENAFLIGFLEERVSELNEQLALKQNFIGGSCLKENS